MFAIAIAMIAASAGDAAAEAVTSMKPIIADERTTLKPGWRAPGVAAWNLQLISTTASPPGFTDPTFEESSAPPAQPGPDAKPSLTAGPAQGTALSNTDMGFSRGRVVLGNFHGFNLFDTTDPKAVKLLASVVCPGGQGDVSIHDHLVFFSVEQTRGRVDCSGSGTEGMDVGNRIKDANPNRFRGIRIFDIADLTDIRQVAAVQTCRGSHTHTLVPAKGDPKTLYIYNEANAAVRSPEELPGCSDKDPEEDAGTSLYTIDIIKVPLDAPEKAAVIANPRIFQTGNRIDGLWQGGDHGEGTQKSRATNHCHDITVYPEMDIAAGACGGNGVLLDISDPTKPTRLDAVVDGSFSYWHGAVFSNDAKTVLYTDESGGGALPLCRAQDPPNWGGDMIFDVEGAKLKPRSHYKLPAAQAANEACVAHNGGLIPIPGRDIVVQAWFSGGVSILDMTDSAHPFEIAYFDRGPLDPQQIFLAGHFSAYWYNGYVYASELTRGLDILALTPSAYLTRNEIAAAELVHQVEYNPQSQTRYVWPERPEVGRAYLDQLTREGIITTSRAATISKRLGRLGSAASVALAARLDEMATKAKGRDVERLAGIARILRAHGEPGA